MTYSAFPPSIARMVYACAIAALTASIGFTQDGRASIAGRVHDMSGAPAPGARVFVEEGVTGPLREGSTGADGAFRIDGVSPGTVGVFAHAAGKAFGGKTVTVSYGEAMSGVDLTLRDGVTLSGTVVDTGEEPVAGARITGALLIEPGRVVGIPLGKLNSFGYPVPRSNDDGTFSVPHMPRGVRVDVKIAHGAHAQLTHPELGNTGDAIMLYPGVFVQGHVLSRGDRLPVSNALLVIQGGGGSVLTQTGGDGSFSVRLNPGPYKARAVGQAFGSGGWQEFNVGESALTQRLTLYVMGKASIRGEVRDAVTEAPVSGAQLNLSAAGSPSERLYTGPNGDFVFETAAGENTVTLGVAPGYLAPATPSMTVTVEPNETYTLPTFWLAPVPAYSLTVIGIDEEPVPNALVSVLRPPQLGWYKTNAAGKVTLALANLPNDGTVVGTVTDARGELGALFALHRGESEDGLVQLTPLGSVRGRVTDDAGKGLSGAIVDARYVDADMPESIPLWRTVSGADGAFSWPHVLPFVPQVCGATATGIGGAGPVYSEETSFLLQGRGPKDLGNLTVANGTGWISMAGKSLPLKSMTRVCGPEPTSGRPHLVVVADPDAVAPWAASLEQVRSMLPDLELHPVIVCESNVPCPGGEVTILTGDLAGAATTYVVDRNGVVVLETFGIPPVTVLRNLDVPNAP